MSDTTPTAPLPPPDKKSMFTNTIALAIIILSALLLVILISLAWANLKPDDPKDPTRFETYTHAKELINILLPVIGTWMGTILAFYFSKENYEAANKQVKDLLSQVSSTDDKLKVVKVTDVMTTADDGTVLKVKDKEEFEGMKINDLILKMSETITERMPILKGDDRTYLFLIYRSTLDRFLQEFDEGLIKFNNPTDPPKAKKDLTVSDMLNSNFEVMKQILAINLDKCFLPVTATLNDARQAMQDNSLCQDVFITQTGKRTEKVLGWITNTKIIEKSELFTKAG
jgi:hypothetical protein